MRIAFLGLGNMGSGMAGRLLAAGHSLAVFNRTAARAAPFEKLGARIADSPRSAASQADIIIGMTADDESSRAMWLGQDGALAADNLPDALAIECSTLSHDWVLELAEKVRARGFRYVDAPVTGLPDAAAAGTLTLLVGADAADLDAARPILTSLATRVLHFGAVGQGTVYKLMINLMGAVQIASAAEGIVLAERAGLDLKLVADAVASGQAASPQVVRNVRRFVAGDHGGVVNFTPALRLKDIDYALRLAKKSGVDCAFGKVAAERLSQTLRTRLRQRQRKSRHRYSAQSLERADGRRLGAQWLAHSDIAGLLGQRTQQHAPRSAAIGSGRDIRAHQAHFGRITRLRPQRAYARRDDFRVSLDALQLDADFILRANGDAPRLIADTQHQTLTGWADVARGIDVEKIGAAARFDLRERDSDKRRHRLLRVERVCSYGYRNTFPRRSSLSIHAYALSADTDSNRAHTRRRLDTQNYKMPAPQLPAPHCGGAALRGLC